MSAMNWGSVVAVYFDFVVDYMVDLGVEVVSVVVHEVVEHHRSWGLAVEDIELVVDD